MNTQKLNRYIVIDLIGVTLLIYTLTLAPSVLMADAGEFQFVAWLPGIAHPTGYPLYVLLGWVFSHIIPFGDVAWRLNFFSAITGATTIGIVYLISLELTTRLDAKISASVHRIIGISSALTFAFTATFWSQVVIAEVYGLHALWVALIIWLTLRISTTLTTLQEQRATDKGAIDWVYGWRLALVFGLSLTHHVTIVLLTPAILLYLWWMGWRQISIRAFVNLMALVLAPLILYLYLPLIATSVPYTQLELGPDQTLVLYEQTIPGFFRHITGQVFASDVRPEAITLERLVTVGDMLRQEVGWVGGLFALFGLLSLLKNFPLLLLTGGGFLGFLAFNLVYFIGDIFVLFIPCWLILSLWIGIGWFRITIFVTNQIVTRKRARVTDVPGLASLAQRVEQNLQLVLLIGLSSLLFILPVVLLISGYQKIDQSQNTLPGQAWGEILAAELPKNAILISNDRNEIMPMWYFQYVENRRPDLLGLFPLITPNPEMMTIGLVLDQALATDRPVYLVKPMPGLEIKADLQPLDPLPHAQLIKTMPPKRTPDQAVTLQFADQLMITGYDQHQNGDQITVTLYWQLGQRPVEYDYTSYVHLVNSANQGKAQSQDHRPGGIYYPTSHWQLGEILRDTHVIPIPNTLASGEYRLVAGLYRHGESGDLENLGEPQTLTAIMID